MAAAATLQGITPSASSSRLPVSNGKKPTVKAGGSSTVVPSGIPISRSRILSTSPRSPSTSSFTAASPSPQQNAPHREPRGTGKGTGYALQPSTSLSQTTPRAGLYDSRDQHLAVSGLRSVSRSVSERSIDRQSVDSVQLALKLAGSSDIDDADSDRQSSRGLRFIQDELPPFVSNLYSGPLELDEVLITSAKTIPRSAAGMASDIREIDLTELPDDPLPFEPDPASSAKLPLSAVPGHSIGASTPIHTPIRQISSNRNHRPVPPRSDPAIPRSSSVILGTRNKPVGVFSVRQRTAIAVKAAHGTTPRSSSAQQLGQMAATGKKPLSTSSPSSIGRTAGASHALSSSTSSREHYPVEAYMIPRIAEYKPANGDWENTVIPTHARGLGIYANADMNGAEGDDDELVTEWTPDGRPVRVVKVGEKHVTRNGGLGDSARIEIAQKKEHLGDDMQARPTHTAPRPSSPSPEPDHDNPVLADILQDYVHPETVATQDTPSATMTSVTNPELQTAQSLRRDDYGDALRIKALDETQPDILPPSTAKPRLYTNELTESDRRVQGNLGLQHSPATNMPKQAPSHTQSQHTDAGKAIPSHHEIRSEPSLSTSGLRSVPNASSGEHASTLDRRHVEMQSMRRDKKPPPPSDSRTKQKSKEEHVGGCRCIIM